MYEGQQPEEAAVLFSLQSLSLYKMAYDLM